MGLNNDEADKLVKEGIDLSSDVMQGIYNVKKKKMITFSLAALVIIGVLTLALCIAGYPAYGIAAGAGGVMIFIVLLVHNLKKLQGLKRELDALQHYISY